MTVGPFTSQASTHFGLFVLIGLLAVFTAAPLQAQTYTVLHAFTGPEGISPVGTLTMDDAGNLYGTTSLGGGSGCGGAGCGTVLKLSRKNGSWILSRLYSFQGGTDGASPYAGVVFGPDGSLYGTTASGGGGSCQENDFETGPGCGTVFNLKPQPRNCPTPECPWIETVLHRFTGGSDGGHPMLGKLIFDTAGNMYGTTSGDFADDGTVFQLSRSGGQWSYTILHNFVQGEEPIAGVAIDSSRNLYGTTTYGDNVFELVAPSGWAYESIYSFAGGSDGSYADGGVTLDSAGNLLGTTFQTGVAYKLTNAQGSWALSVLTHFQAYDGPFDTLTLDAAGNAYGTIYEDAPGVFKMTPSGTLTDLHDFGASTGIFPMGGVVVDASGNVYGTTTQGGAGSCFGGSGCGVVFEITP